jgi:hypothetical protein
LAFTIKAENVNQSGFGYDSVGFSTAYDGGFGSIGSDEMWHVFASFIGEDPDGDPTIAWVVLHRGRALRFAMSIEALDHTGWPGVSFDKLWERIEANIEAWNWANTHASNVEEVEVPEGKEYLTPSQLKYAKRFEKEYFSRFGQGAGPMFRRTRVTTEVVLRVAED